MGLSLSSLNPVKAIRQGFESITGVSDARAGIKSANAAQQAAIQQAISGLQAGGGLATTTLEGGRDLSSQALGVGRGGALQAIRSGTGEAINTLNPVANLFDPTALAQNFSVEGFGNQLASFADPSGAFAGLFDQRQQSATDALSAAGLSRSGRASEEAARIDLETALGLSNTLFGRQIQNPALAAIQNISNLQANQGGNIANIESGFGRDISGLEGAFASDIANLQLGEASNIANLNIGAGASEAQALQAIGGLRGQAAAPFIEGAISLGTKALTGGFG